MYSAGSIYWLPPKEQICSDHLLTTDLLEDGCFNHPVVILATDSSHKEAALLIVCAVLDTLLHDSSDHTIDHIIEGPELTRTISTCTGQETACGSCSHTPQQRASRQWIVLLPCRWRATREEQLREIEAYTGCEDGGAEAMAAR
jgi:hypothetical protein